MSKPSVLSQAGLAVTIPHGILGGAAPLLDKLGNYMAMSCADYIIIITHDGSMVLLYMVCHGSHQYTPTVSINIPAPWIRHG